MKKEYYDASEVKQSCSQNIKAIITDLYPNAKFKGAEARIGGVDGSKGNSMSVSLDPSKFGAYYDHATGEKGDLISLVEYAKSTNYGGAIEWLGASYTSCTKRKYEPQASLTLAKKRSGVQKTVVTTCSVRMLYRLMSPKAA